MMKGLQHLSYDEKQSRAVWPMEEKGYLISVYEYPMGAVKQTVRLFSVVPSDRTKDNGHKLKHRKFHLNITKYLFLVWVVKSQTMLLRDIVESSSKKMETQMNRALGNLLLGTLL